MATRRSRRPSRLLPILFASIALGAVACGFGFSPGDYGGAASGGDGGDGGAEGSSLTDSALADGPKLPDGAPAPVSHLVLIAGERDGTDTAAGDVWSAPIYADNSLGEFTALAPTFFRGTKTSWSLANGQLFVATRSPTSNRAVEWVDFDGGVAGAWRGSLVPNPSSYNYAQVFAGSSLLALGGQHNETLDGGATQNVFDDTVVIAALTDAGYPSLTTSSSTLAQAAAGLTTFLYKDFVYTFGGYGPANDQASKVYVAHVDAAPDVAVGEFKETTRLTNPTNGQPYPIPQQAILCAGASRMFVIGGSNNDIVITAPINETDGTLGAWKGAPKLPGALRSAGCALVGDMLHLFGGVGATSRTDRVLRAQLKPDGTLGEWEISSGTKLPAPRSSIVAFVH